MSDPRKLPYRPCVGLCIFNAAGKVFVGQRIDGIAGAWQMPQGGIDPGESIEAAAKREMMEEIGTDKADIIRIYDTPLRYDIPPDVLARVPWGTQYGGQEQTWVALRFNGTDADIRLDAWDHPEFSQYRWIDLEEIVNIVVPFKVSTYEHVVEAFRDIPQ